MANIKHPMTDGYLEQMEAHVDAGGTLSHANATDLLQQVMQQREAMKEALEYFSNREDITHQGCANEEMKLAHGLREVLGRGYDARTFTAARQPLSPPSTEGHNQQAPSE